MSMRYYCVTSEWSEVVNIDLNDAEVEIIEKFAKEVTTQTSHVGIASCNVDDYIGMGNALHHPDDETRLAYDKRQKET